MPRQFGNTSGTIFTRLSFMKTLALARLPAAFMPERLASSCVCQLSRRRCKGCTKAGLETAVLLPTRVGHANDKRNSLSTSWQEYATPGSAGLIGTNQRLAPAHQRTRNGDSMFACIVRFSSRVVSRSVRPVAVLQLAAVAHDAFAQ